MQPSDGSIFLVDPPEGPGETVADGIYRRLIESILFGDLADSRRRLALLQLQCALAEAQDGAAERDGPGRHHQHFHAVLGQFGNIVGQRGEPVVLQSFGAIHEQRRADLDGDATVFFQR